MDSRHDDDDDEYLPPPSERSSSKRTSRSAPLRPRRGAAPPAPTGFGVPEMLDNLDEPAKSQARRPASPVLGHPAMVRWLDGDEPARSNRDDYDAGRLTPPVDDEDGAERPKRALHDDDGDDETDGAAAAAAARRYQMTRDVSGSESPRSDGEASEVELPSKRKKGKKDAEPPPMPTEPVQKHSASSTRKRLKEFMERNRALPGVGQAGPDDKPIKVAVSGRFYLIKPMAHTKDAIGGPLKAGEEHTRRDGKGRSYAHIAKSLDAACARLHVQPAALNQCVRRLLDDQHTTLAELQATVPTLDAAAHALICELAMVLLIDSARAGHAHQLIRDVALGPGTFQERFGNGTKGEFPTYVGAWKVELHKVGGSQKLQAHTKAVHDARVAAGPGAGGDAAPSTYVAKPMMGPGDDEVESDELILELSGSGGGGGPSSSSGGGDDE